MSTEAQVSLLQGTLDLLILRTLRLTSLHGHGITKAIQRHSDDMVHVEHGSLYPALHRLEKKGLIASEWKQTDRTRPVKVYSITPAGRKQLTIEQSKWKQLVEAISLVLRRA